MTAERRATIFARAVALAGLAAALSFGVSAYAGHPCQGSGGTTLGPGCAQAYDADLTTLGAGGASARSFLGLAISTDVQAYDADLTTLGALGAGARTALALTPGTDVQAVHVTTSYSTSHTITAAECAGNTTLNNSGASALVTLTLPSSPVAGYLIAVDCVDTDGVKVLAPASTTIRMPNGTVSGSAGYIHSITLGADAVLECVSSTAWVAREVSSVWRVDLATGAGFAFTPTTWVSFTGTGGWTTNTTYSLSQYRQVGNVLELYWYISLAGTPNSAQLYLDMPAGLTVDATALSSPYNGRVGQGNSCASTTTANTYPLSMDYLASVPGKVYVYNATSPETATDQTSAGTGYRLALHAQVPVQ